VRTSIIEVGGILCWKGTLRSNKGNHYVVLMKYPDGFPFSYPKVYIVSPDVRKEKPPHIFPDGQLSVLPFKRPYQKNVITASMVVTLTIVWIVEYENWQDTGTWCIV